MASISVSKLGIDKAIADKFNFRIRPLLDLN